MRTKTGFLFGLTVEEIKVVAKTVTPGTSIWSGCFDLQPPVKVIDKETRQPHQVRKIGVEGINAGRIMLVGTNNWLQAWDFELPKKV